MLEHLPARLSNPDETHIVRLRDRLRLHPDDAVAAAELAERYYRIAQRLGDPRYIGYAQAVLSPWNGTTQAPVDVRLARALLAQFMHDFSSARRDLDSALAVDPKNLAALSYRAVLHLVSANYPAARADCLALEQASQGLIIAACRPTVDALTGAAESSYRQLQTALRRHPDAPTNERLWVLSRLAEIALRLDRIDEADAHFKAAMALGITDQYLLATTAEFLLDQNRAGEVIALLGGHTANDVLLLRLALAEHASGHTDAPRHIALLQQRFEANRRRGDTTHLADEAIFELRFNNNAKRALALATENWSLEQREPSDARIVLEAALAAGRRDEAEPVLRWLRDTQHQDRRLIDLARRVVANTPPKDTQ